MAGPVVAVIGHRDRGDDAAGPLVADALRASRADLRVIELGADPVGLLEVLASSERVIVVDAVRSGAAPGTVRRFTGDDADFPAEPAGGSTHGFGLAAVLALARATGRVAAHLEIVGIEGADFALGGAIHPAVRRAALEVAAAIAREHPPGP